MCDSEYVQRCTFDSYLYKTVVNGLVQNIELPETEGGAYKVKYSRYDGKSRGTPSEAEFDIIVGADGANSRTAKVIDAGQYNFAIAFQERIKIPQEKMEYS